MKTSIEQENEIAQQIEKRKNSFEIEVIILGLNRGKEYDKLWTIYWILTTFLMVYVIGFLENNDGRLSAGLFLVSMIIMTMKYENKVTRMAYLERIIYENLEKECNSDIEKIIH